MIIDVGRNKNGGLAGFLLSPSNAAKNSVKEPPKVPCFPEASRTQTMTRATWTVDTGIPTYFWLFLPVEGSQKTIEALGKFCEEKFGAKLHVITQKMESQEKAERLMKDLKRL